MTTGRRRAPDAIVEGKPHLVINDEDTEVVADALADLLLADLDEGEREDGAS